MNRKNRYSCEKCGHHIITVDTHEGTTPFAIPCDKCQKYHMGSAFYAVDQTLEPTHEWYRATEKEIKAITKEELKKYSPELIASMKADRQNPEKVIYNRLMDHHILGGLFLRKIEKV